MDGPSHYREAEKWLGFAKQWWESGDDPTSAATATAAATIGQVHAALAHTAATALGREMKMHAVDAEPWMRMLSADTQWRDRPTIVCLCGSTRFYDAFQQANYDETMAGRIVLSVGFYPHAKAEHGHGEGVGHDSVEKAALDELHKRKIDLADEVLVLNVGGYIGDSTRSEVAYAEKSGKPVRYLEPLAEAGEF